MPLRRRAALGGAVLAVLLAGGPGTVALWRGSGSMDPGAVKTGSLALTAGDGAAAGKDYLFKDLGTSELAPGGFVQAPLVISNEGTSKLGFTLAGAASLPASPTPADVALGAAARLIIHAIDDAAGCSREVPSTGILLYAGPLGAEAGFTQRQPLAAPGQGTSQAALCVRLSLPAATPQAAAGGRLALVLTWRGDQW